LDIIAHPHQEIARQSRERWRAERRERGEASPPKRTRTTKSRGGQWQQKSFIRQFLEGHGIKITDVATVGEGKGKRKADEHKGKGKDEHTGKGKDEHRGKGKDEHKGKGKDKRKGTHKGSGKGWEGGRRIPQPPPPPCRPAPQFPPSLPPPPRHHTARSSTDEWRPEPPLEPPRIPDDWSHQQEPPAGDLDDWMPRPPLEPPPGRAPVRLTPRPPLERPPDRASLRLTPRPPTGPPPRRSARGDAKPERPTKAARERIPFKSLPPGARELLRRETEARRASQEVDASSSRHPTQDR